MALQLRQPHDALFRAMLADPQRADSILRAHLDPQLLRMLAAEPPQPLDGSFVDESLRASCSDKLLRVRLRGGKPGFLYVLVEHKSWPDRGTALQVCEYKVRIRRQDAGGSVRALRDLPAIVPLVFYHGRAPWSAPRSIAAMLGSADPFLQGLEPNFGYFLRNLNELPEEELADDPGAWAGLMLLRYSHRGPAAMEQKLALLPRILVALPDGSLYQRQGVVYVMNVWHVPQAVLSAVAEEALPGRGERMVGHVVQELLDQGALQGRAEGRAEGLTEGRAEGLTEGRAEGLIEGRAEDLTWLLEHRFGALPAEVRGRIADASSGELQTWFKVALDAPSLGTVFNGNSLG